MMNDTFEPRLSSRFESARTARVAAVQALFQIETTQRGPSDVIQEFQEHRLPSDDYPYLPNIDLFNHLVATVYEFYDKIEALIVQELSEEWTIETLDPVLKATLMTGTTELLHKPSTLPAPVIISEYVDIARGFCGEKEAGFANKILDHIAQVLNLPLVAPKM
jgi:N utilization substance protein B